MPRGRPPKRTKCVHCRSELVGVALIREHRCNEMEALLHVRSRHAPEQDEEEPSTREPSPVVAAINPVTPQGQSPIITPRTAVAELKRLRTEIRALRQQQEAPRQQQDNADNEEAALRNESPEPEVADFTSFSIYEGTEGTTKGHQLLCFDGDHFRWVKAGKGFWQCIHQRATRCKIKGNVVDGVFKVRGLADEAYCHLPWHDSNADDCARYHAKQNLKVVVQDRPNVPVPELHREALVNLRRQGRDEILPTLPSLTSTLHRARTTLHPLIPKSVDDFIAVLMLAMTDLEELADDAEKIRQYVNVNGKPFLREVIEVDGETAVLFADDDGIRRLTDADRWFGDGTFDVSIHVNIATSLVFYFPSLHQIYSTNFTVCIPLLRMSCAVSSSQEPTYS